MQTTLLPCKQGDPKKKATSFLIELRNRVTYYFFGFLFAFTFAYYQKDILLYRLFQSLSSLPHKWGDPKVASLSTQPPLQGNSTPFPSPKVPLANIADRLEGTSSEVNETFETMASPTTFLGVASPSPSLGQSNAGGTFGEVIFLEITEAFYTELYMIFVISFFISLPLFWIQVWFFLAPGLFSKEQFFLALLSLCSWLLILFFAYFTEKFLLPKAWTFFLSFGDLSSLNNGVPSTQENSHVFDTSSAQEWGVDSKLQLRFMPSIALYWKLYFQILLAMICSSQFPIILFLLVHWKWLTMDFLIKGRPWWIVFFLSWGALLSPPDLLSQFIIFFPLFFFYEFVVFFTFCQKRWNSMAFSTGAPFLNSLRSNDKIVIVKDDQ